MQTVAEIDAKVRKDLHQTQDQEEKPEQNETGEDNGEVDLLQGGEPMREPRRAHRALVLNKPYAMLMICLCYVH